ncbi:gliding motility-associated peptidyl-prolyl isomerase GldI [Flavobacterium sp.]|uniref:gliding motility-associated peptidyl-prolyl isomerase GldI n=1 Tax=Flavobacterium sp. TaxID=239 RepID=UPI002629087F|nr:gliding motility-associated peptidyl-prolyl isomerase GldI [Flavobacterium sp.]MDD3003942.1 gliding motility-associated peptidyl-prolyl isomerase GldI [Flavobacterium sp.]
MNFTSRILILSAVTLTLLSCSQQQARRPITQTSGKFMKESVNRNIKLIANEEASIEEIIKQHPERKYIASPKGYWYYYEQENTKDTLTPKRGDVAFFDYEIADLNGNIIYSEVELKPQTYLVDKQNILMGLRDGIKIMNKNEKISFLFPSHLGHGYRGDNDRIPPNLPLVVKVSLRDFKPEAVARAEKSVPLLTTNKNEIKSE